jgi:hypothetical protein
LRTSPPLLQLEALIRAEADRFAHTLESLAA